MRELKILIALTALLYLALGGTVLYFNHVGRVARTDLRRDETRNTAALCAVRANDQQRIANSQEFLRENPHGAPGISRKVVLVAINNDRNVVKALSIVHCPPGRN